MLKKKSVTNAALETNSTNSKASKAHSRAKSTVSRTVPGKGSARASRAGVVRRSDGGGHDDTDGSTELQVRLEIETRRCGILESQMETLLIDTAKITEQQRKLDAEHHECVKGLENKVSALRSTQDQERSRMHLLDQKLKEAVNICREISAAVDEKHVQLALHFVPRTAFTTEVKDFCKHLPLDSLPSLGKSILFGGHEDYSIIEDEEQEIHLSDDVGEGKANQGWALAKVRMQDMWAPQKAESDQNKVQMSQRATDASKDVLGVDAPLLYEKAWNRALPNAPCDYKKGDIILKQNKRTFNMYRIAYGSVNVVINKKAVATLSEGDYFGEVSALYDTSPIATCIAVAPTRVYAIPKEVIETRLANAFPRQVNLLRKLGRVRCQRYIIPHLLHRNPYLKKYAKNAEFIDKIVRYMYIKAEPSWSSFIREGEVGGEMHFIITGEYEVKVRGELVVILSGGFFGEMALTTGCLRQACVASRTPALTVVLPRRGFEKLAHCFPEFANDIASLHSPRTAAIKLFLEFYLVSPFLQYEREAKCLGAFRLLSEHSTRIHIPPLARISPADLHPHCCYHVAAGLATVEIPVSGEVGDDQDVFTDHGKGALVVSSAVSPIVDVVNPSDTVALVLYRIGVEGVRKIAGFSPHGMQAVLQDLLKTGRSKNAGSARVHTYLSQVRHQLQTLSEEDEGVCVPLSAGDADRLKDMVSDKVFESSRAVASSPLIPRPPSSTGEYLGRSE